MGRPLLLLLATATLFAADDPWTKVKELSPGADVRILRQSVKKPLEAKLDEARDDVLIVHVKNRQESIPKSDIDRLDYRRSGRETSSEIRRGIKIPGPTTYEEEQAQKKDGYSAGVKLSKPAYETIYRRP